MQYTPNFNFSIAEGTDTVNLLTQSYPNFTALDTYLEDVKATGITKAVHTKVGTVHELVRADADCEVFRFVATSNFAVNDTFTVDGVAVTTTAMDGTALPAGAFVINQSVEAILNGLVLTIVGVRGQYTAAGTSFDNSGTNYVSNNVEGALKEVGPKGEVSVTADGVKTRSQILDELFSLVDTTKIGPRSVLVEAGASVQLFINSVTSVTFTCFTLTAAALSLQKYLITASGSSLSRWAIDGNGATYSDLSATVPGSGSVYKVLY